MFPHTSAVLLVLGILAGPASADSNATTCTLTEVQFAAAINTLRDWPKIHAFHQANFPPCPDAGMFAAGYSELVVRTLATNWCRLDELRVLASQDQKFKAFVLGHIDATTNGADLRAIQTSASSMCSIASRSLCAEIHRAASGALRELGER